METSSIFDRLVDNNVQLAITVSVLAVVIIVGARRVGSRPLAEQFPRLSAIVDLVLGPLAVIVLGSLARVAARQFGVENLDDGIRAVTVFATYVVATLMIARAIEIFVLSSPNVSVTSRLTGILRGLYYGGCLLFGVALYLRVQGISITGVWVSTGVAAALAGFALQKTLGDLFSGIALSIERPFRTGDWLELDDGTVGQVTDVNWRATRLRTWDNATYVVPNGELAGQSFKNLHGPTHVYAPWYLIKVPSDVDPRFAKALLLDAALRCKGVLKQPLPIVRIADGSTLPYTYMVWVHFPNYPSMFAGREELFREIHYAFKEVGIRISAPIQEFHTRRAPISSAEPPNILAALKNLDVAGDYTDDELEHVARASQYLTFDSGTTILREGAVAEGFDVILSGIVHANIELADGRKKRTAELRPGEYFGITSMMMSEPSALEFTAQTDVTVIRVNTDCVRSVLEGRPDRADKLAAIVKQRMDAAKQARAESRRPTPGRSVHEILRRIEESLSGHDHR